MPPRRSSSARLFAALGDETRLRIVARLCAEGPLSIRELTAGSRVTRQAVTKHLRLMERCGLTRGARRGRESVWQVDARHIDNARHYLDRISAQWDKALRRLQAFVE